MNVLKLITQEIPTFLMVFFSPAGEIIRLTNTVHRKVAPKKQSSVKNKNASAKPITRFVITLLESTTSIKKSTTKLLEAQLKSLNKLILKCKRLPIEFHKCSRSLNKCSKALASTKAMKQSDKQSPITFEIQTKKRQGKDYQEIVFMNIVKHQSKRHKIGLNIRTRSTKRS